MDSRGRGRGGRSGTTINGEQLGLSKGEALEPVLHPPAKYPPLENKPIPFTINSEMSYLMELKREFAEYMRESKNNVLPVIVKKDIERYSDRYQDLVNGNKSYEVMYDWSRMPAELKSTKKRKNKDSDSQSKKLKDINIEKKLQELESKESTQQSDIEDEEKGEDEEDDEEKNASEQIEGEDDETDDDGTDYVNSYFDNGEGYDEEDENMDDGATFN